MSRRHDCKLPPERRIHSEPIQSMLFSVINVDIKSSSIAEAYGSTNKKQVTPQ